ncbi:hypothetical protein [Aquisphaera insulae]|uniref:hypothetical protein n=1 Tax=Aquisphaera insulae TaxID=2712864 RepID=UPI0013EDF659|nr:hypothetical protein [Aquisphaera insulae]
MADKILPNDKPEPVTDPAPGTPTPRDPRMPTKKLYRDYKLVRAGIEHENNLLNHRFTWLFATHTFLFAALGFIWTRTYESPGEVSGIFRMGFLQMTISHTPPVNHHDKIEILVMYGLICILGILFCLYIGRSIYLAGKQIDYLEMWWLLQYANSGLPTEDETAQGTTSGHTPQATTRSIIDKLFKTNCIKSIEQTRSRTRAEFYLSNYDFMRHALDTKYPPINGIFRCEIFQLSHLPIILGVFWTFCFLLVAVFGFRSLL